jgi:hypothetical protein
MIYTKKGLLNPTLYFEKYKCYRNCYNKLIKHSKQITLDQKFKKYRYNSKKTWDLLKETALGSCNTSKNEISEIVNNGSSISSTMDIANTFNEFFVNVGQNISDGIPDFDMDPLFAAPIPDPNRNNFEFEDIGPVWITDVVKQMANKSSPDLDGLNLKFLKQIIFHIADPLSYIFTLSLRNGIFPDKLKECRIVPIFKNGDNKLCDNYRPISLVNTISKILEKIVSIKLTNYLQINELIYKHQYGFQKGMSTEQNLTH